MDKQTYYATRFINRRIAQYCEFEATDNDTALKQLLEDEARGEIDWEDGEDSDITPFTSDIILALDVEYGAAARQEVKWGIRLPADMPYTDDARTLVQKVAALDRDARRDVIEEFDKLILECRKLCGQEENKA
jgi:hypothetical protein